MAEHLLMRDDTVEFTFRPNIDWKPGLVGWLIRRFVRFTEGEALTATVTILEVSGPNVRLATSEHRHPVRANVLKDN